MALRNAFEEIGLEGTLRQILRAVGFAKDPQDRLRVVVDSQPTVLTYMNNSSTSTNGNPVGAWYGAAAWNMMDPRDEMREASHQSFQITRNRWTIT